MKSVPSNSSVSFRRRKRLTGRLYGRSPLLYCLPMSLPPTNDIIAAIATAPGAAAIGIIRLSGPDSHAIAGQLFRPRSGNSLPSPGSFAVGEFADGAEVIDEGLLLMFADGRSYTGQQSVELQVHGSQAVLRRLLSACLARGARQAEPGEFTMRAWLNGKLDLAQAESVLELINSESEAGRRNAQAGLSGELSRRIDDLQSRITAVYGSLQAQLDYPDEGVEESEFVKPLKEVAREIAALLDSAVAGRIANRGARLALTGRPNSGKSSLLNALLGFERSLVSDVPGTTRDYLEARLELEGVPVTLVDTAGLRDSEDEIESRGVSFSRSIADSADLVLIVLDPRQDAPAEPLTLQLLEAVPAERRLALWSKADLEQAPRLAGVDLAVSSVDGRGLAELRLELAERLSGDRPAGELQISVERHAAALQRALDAVEAAAAAPEDLAALDLAQALAALSAITGRHDVASETIQHIFANFCVGKRTAGSGPRAAPLHVQAAVPERFLELLIRGVAQARQLREPLQSRSSTHPDCHRRLIRKPADAPHQRSGEPREHLLIDVEPLQDLTELRTDGFRTHGLRITQLRTGGPCSGVCNPAQSKLSSDIPRM